MKTHIHDAEFPGLGAALDMEGVLGALRAALPECRNGVQLLGGTLVDVRYRPGGPCWILYNLNLRHGDNRSVRQLLSGRVLRQGEAPKGAPEALVRRYAGSADRALSTPVLVLPAVPMILYAFPVDAAMPGLFEATDPEAMRGHLGALWSARRVRVHRVRSRLLGYTPHARAAFRYEVLSEARGTGVPELRRLVGKMHAKKEPARLFADAWAVWRAARGRVNLAPPVGYLPSAGLTLQEMVEGERLGGLVEHPEFRKWVRQAACMLAKLHGLAVPLSSRRRAPEEAQTVHRWAGVLRTIRSDLGERVERLGNRIASEVLARAEATAPIHGDFHHTNILVHGEAVTFIDFDEAALGDPMVDVGRFLASLRVPARRAFGDIGALRDAREAFLETYLHRRDDDPRRARLFEAASLLIAGASAFRIQRATWVEEVAELIADAERVLREACEIRVAGPGSARRSQPPTAPGRWAADGIFMQATLAPHVRRAFGAELIECRVVERPDDGATRVRYDLHGSREAEPWRAGLVGVLRRGGGGRAVMERMETIRQALEASAHGVRLPRPVAYLGGLSLLVYEPPGGERLASFVDSPEALTVAERLAEGLRALHTAPVELGCAPRTLDEDLQRLSLRVRTRESNHADIVTAVTSVLAAVERATHQLPVRLAPVLRTVHPKHVVWDGTRVGLERLDDLAVSDPLQDVADFVARCVVLGATEGKPVEWEAVAARFREAYLSAAGEDDDDLTVFEACALLRLGCGRVRRSADTGLSRQLLEIAEAKLMMGGTRR